MQGYERDPRSLAKRAEAYLKSTGIADYALFGPENEFFIFDSVTYNNDMNGAGYRIDSVQGAWNSSQGIRTGQHGPPSGHQGRLLPGASGRCFSGHPLGDVPALEEMGLKVEVHHHEVATGGQCEIGVGAGTLVKKADEVQILKYAILNVANGYGKTATFMPKPLVGDNGSGMHVHQSPAERRQGPLRGRQVRRPFRHRALLHRRHHQAREGAQRLHESRHQQLQAPRPGIRSAGDARVLRAQPLGLDPYSVRVEPEGAPYRSALPGLRARIPTSRSRP